MGVRGFRPYVIAEIGVNHEGSMEKALELIALAKEGGADAQNFKLTKQNLWLQKIAPTIGT